MPMKNDRAKSVCVAGITILVGTCFGDLLWGDFVVVGTFLTFWIPIILF